MIAALAVAADAYRIATDARHVHMGWRSETWDELASQRANNVGKLIVSDKRKA
jgi:hypothetical protein